MRRTPSGRTPESSGALYDVQRGHIDLSGRFSQAGASSERPRGRAEPSTLPAEVGSQGCRSFQKKFQFSCGLQFGMPPRHGRCRPIPLTVWLSPARTARRRRVRPWPDRTTPRTAPRAEGGTPMSRMTPDRTTGTNIFSNRHEALSGRLVGLRFGHHVHHARQRAVPGQFRHLDGEKSLSVDGAGKDH